VSFTDARHLVGLKVLKAGPALIVEGLALVVRACRENAAGREDAQAFGFAFWTVCRWSSRSEGQLFDHAESRLEAPPGQNAFQIWSI